MTDKAKLALIVTRLAATPAFALVPLVGMGSMPLRWSRVRSRISLPRIQTLDPTSTGGGSVGYNQLLREEP